VVTGAHEEVDDFHIKQSNLKMHANEVYPAINYATYMSNSHRQHSPEENGYEEKKKNDQKK
jgi:hypothetical protein